ncbi:MAG TPA: hypothetical protein VGK67_15310 [Myxococcales bacterium]|jgi:hypothetical protein
MAHRVIPFLALFVLACGGLTSSSGDAGTPSAPKELDCAWAASESNCWKEVIKVADGCLPSQSEVGAFSADLKTCTFSGGKVVTFDPAATLPPSDLGLSFSIKDCVSRTGLAKGHFKVQTSAGTVEQSSPGEGLLVTCPDGSRYQIANVLDLTQCAGAGASLDYVPGDLWTWNGGVLAYGFTNWPGNQSRTLFTCQQ